MNLNDLLKIGTGVVIALVFAGTAKWLFALFDAVVPVSKAPEKLRRVLSVKANRSFLGTSLIFVLQIGATISFALDKSPITRLSILLGTMLFVASLLILLIFMWELQSVLRERRRDAKITVR
jgi:heme A synthase